MLLLRLLLPPVSGGVLRARALALWATVRMEALIRRVIGGVAVRELRRMRRGRAAGEGVEALLTHGEVVGGRRCAGLGTGLLLTGPLRADVGDLMRGVLGVEHHLLISPLCELGVGGVVVGVLGVHLLLGVEGVRLLVLVEGGAAIELLRRMGCGPAGLLLLHGVRVRLLRMRWRRLSGRGDHGARVVVVGRGGSLTRDGGVDGDGGRGGRGVHRVISRWMPVLRDENGHGLQRGRVRVQTQWEKRSCSGKGVGDRRIGGAVVVVVVVRKLRDKDGSAGL